jgi:hypothetical protein
MNGQDDFAGVPPATGCALCADCGGGCDQELRGAGEAALAGAIASVRQYITSELAADPRYGLRPYAVFLFTDGIDTCGGDPLAEAAALCDLGVPVLVVGADTPRLAGGLEALAAAGCRPGCDLACTGELLAAGNEAALSRAVADLIRAGTRYELCNGLDDDNDGLIDEGYPGVGEPCTTTQGCPGIGCCTLQGPVLCCGPPPACESCNLEDDDCDGTIDNGDDVDCDGDIDQPCPRCYPEECNGYDDDCDGQTDEGPLIVDGYPCGRDVGACASGTTCCVDGAPGCCGAIGPSVESCDCQDNDCNGLTDELPEEACFTLGNGCDEASGTCRGICQVGRRAPCVDVDPGPGCTTGAGACLGQRGPDPEACNCLDDDCDGRVDDGAECPGGGRCETCACPAECDPGAAGACEPGYLCKCEDATNPVACFCQTACGGVECGPCEACHRDDGVCHTLCEAVTCPAWTACTCGRCEDASCSNPAIGCPSGEVCRNHSCQPAPRFLLTSGGAGGCACDLRASAGRFAAPWLILLACLAHRVRGGGRAVRR